MRISPKERGENSETAKKFRGKEKPPAYRIVQL